MELRGRGDIDGQACEGSRGARGLRANQWTRDKKLRAPVFLGLRDAKRPIEVVREASPRL